MIKRELNFEGFLFRIMIPCDYTKHEVTSVIQKVSEMLSGLEKKGELEEFHYDHDKDNAFYFHVMGSNVVIIGGLYCD